MLQSKLEVVLYRQTQAQAYGQHRISGCHLVVVGTGVLFAEAFTEHVEQGYVADRAGSPLVHRVGYDLDLSVIHTAGPEAVHRAAYSSMNLAGYRLVYRAALRAV